MKRRTFFALSGSALAVPAPVSQLWAQNWPDKPITMVVPFTAGGAGDILARVLNNRLEAMWGKGFVVENRPGGDSLIAIRAVIADNDDHQFLFTPSGNFTPHPYRHEKLGYVREQRHALVVHVLRGHGR